MLPSSAVPKIGEWELIFGRAVKAFPHQASVVRGKRDISVENYYDVTVLAETQTT